MPDVLVTDGSAAKASAAGRTGMKRYAILLGIVAVCVLAFSLRSCKPEPPTIIVPGTGDAYAAHQDSIAHLTRQANDLRSRLANLLSARAIVHVDTVIRYDTIIPPPDTVLLSVTIDGDGRAEVDAGVKQDSGYVPETRKLELRDCDDGVVISGQGVQCDRARLGHAEVFASVGAGRTIDDPLSWYANAAAGVAWQPSYRSTTDIALSIDARRVVSVSVRKGVRLF